MASSNTSRLHEYAPRRYRAAVARVVCGTQRTHRLLLALPFCAAAVLSWGGAVGSISISILRRRPPLAPARVPLERAHVPRAKALRTARSQRAQARACLMVGLANKHE
eukprot:235903-Pleurochrysis_carterae.AAC.2